MKISCVIITKNEERNIDRCLQSVTPVVDEIIIIDSFSDDSTIDICKKYKAKIEQKSWEGYTATKNYGNSLAIYPYILSIDADEALSEKLQYEIIEIKRSSSPADAYYMNRLTNYCGKWIRHCGWYPDWKIRLWNKESGGWTGHIHEHLELKKNINIKRFKNNLLHYSYYCLQDHLTQISKFTDLMAEENYQKKKSYSILKIVFSPLRKFFTCYFLKLGFLDAYNGFVISLLSSYATFLKYAKTRELVRSEMKKRSIN